MKKPATNLDHAVVRYVPDQTNLSLMKTKALFFVLGISFAIGLFALYSFRQNQKTEVVYEYSQLLGMQKFLSKKIVITVDFGTSVSQSLKDPMGKPINFNSMVDAFNYMAKDGWEFQQAYVVTVGQQNVYHWLMKRKINTNN